MLTLPLLNHSYRTYLFGRALGELEGLDVDAELLFAAAMLHDTGLVAPPVDADFTLASSRFARDVAEQVGLSTAATDTMLNAITMHHTPGVSPDAGPEAYLLSAGAAVDVIGFRCLGAAGRTPSTRPSTSTRAPSSSRSSPPRSDKKPPASPRAAPGSCTATARFAAAIRLAPFDD